jgi:hypothetical protein
VGATECVRRQSSTRPGAGVRWQQNSSRLEHMLTLYRVCVRRNSIKRVLGDTWAAHTLSPFTQNVQGGCWITMM